MLTDNKRKSVGNKLPWVNSLFLTMAMWCVLWQKKNHALWVYTHGANDQRHKITISFSTVIGLWLLLYGFDTF